MISLLRQNEAWHVGNPPDLLRHHQGNSYRPLRHLTLAPPQYYSLSCTFGSSLYVMTYNQPLQCFLGLWQNVSTLLRHSLINRSTRKNVTCILIQEFILKCHGLYQPDIFSVHSWARILLWSQQTTILTNDRQSFFARFLTTTWTIFLCRKSIQTVRLF